LGGISAGALLFSAVHGNLQWLTQFLGSRFVIHGAALAYGIYLFHNVIINQARSLYHGSLASPLLAMAFSITMFIPILAVAALAHRFIENPGLRLRDGLREAIPTLP